MKRAYPVIIRDIENEPGYYVYVPDFDISTQGNTLEESIYMARDVIEMIGNDMLEENEALPSASNANLMCHKENEIVVLIDADFQI